MAHYVVTRADGSKVLYYPFEAGPGGVVPDENAETTFVFTQDAAVTPWIINHNLGYNPSVTLMIGGEEADADVTYPSTSQVQVAFGSPQAGTARLT